MEELSQKIISDTGDTLLNDIVTFENNYGTRTTFKELNQNNLREKLWEKLFSCLSDSLQTSIHHKCLSTLRILSRDKTDLNDLLTDDRINVILDNAALKNTDMSNTAPSNVTTEAVKLLCNLVFNSTKLQQTLPDTSCLPNLIKRIGRYNGCAPPTDVMFDIRIIFLITALNVSTRETVRTELNGDECLAKILENIVIKYEQDDKDIMMEDDVTLTCEALKALFNLYLQSDDVTGEPEKTKNLVSLLYKLLLFKCDKEESLQSNVANLLTVIPFDCYSTIIPPAKEKRKYTYENVDMSAIYVLLKFLDKRLNCKEDLIGNLSPIVTAFIRLVKAERLIRKYARLKILPPLRDVMHRPEEGTTLRAKLCKLLTSPLTELRDLVAEFLFILCKENVNRMVKYTGYGNAAGMFANKGLLGPNKKKAAYSSESEDSETEEYLKHKEQINPVTGCFEHPKPNPLEGMSEEQKEYEALQIVDLVDKLTREGVVQPCRIGEDGKPKPIQHVLELQEELPKQQFGRRGSDSD